MRRAPVGDLHQTGPLVRREIADERELQSYLIDDPALGIAGGAVLAMDPRERQQDVHRLQWPPLPVGVHLDRDAGTRSKSRQQELVGIGSAVGTSDFVRLVGSKHMRADRHRLEISPAVAIHVNVSRHEFSPPSEGIDAFISTHGPRLPSLFLDLDLSLA
jgi:hypothetical protein